MFTDEDCLPILEALRAKALVMECGYIALIASIYYQAQRDAKSYKTKSRTWEVYPPTEKERLEAVDFCKFFEDDIIELAQRGGVRIPKNFKKR